MTDKRFAAIFVPASMCPTGHTGSLTIGGRAGVLLIT